MRDRKRFGRVTPEIAKDMKSLTGLRVVLILATVILAVQGRKRECPCAGLGSGTNLCACNEIVVKAAKLPKPAAYVPPHLIAQAAAMRESLASTDDLAKTTSDFLHAYSTGHHHHHHHHPHHYALDVRDLVKGRDNVAPSFPPIGDLCYPLPMHPRTGEIIERITTVIPARPGKPRCNCHMVPYTECLSMLTGHGHHGHPSYRHHDHYGHQRHHGSFGQELSGELLVEEDLRFVEGDRNIEEDAMIDIQIQADDEFGFQRHNAPSRLFGRIGANGGATFRESLTGSISGATEAGFGVEGRLVEEVSDCNSETKQVQVLPNVPADAVSLALAYKNMHAPHVIYKAGRKFVPEDKIAFGHRTVPTEVKVEKSKSDIPEEKLIVVDKPVVELQISPTKTVVVGSYDEKEEARLAELEAVEREYIAQEETPIEPTQNYVSYGELGYAPVGMKPVAKTLPKHPSHGLVIEKNSRAPCGPLGPTVPGYVPGSVVVEEFVESVELDDGEDAQLREGSVIGQVYEEDDSEEEFEEGSGFLSRLHALSRKHGSGLCSR